MARGALRAAWLPVAPCLRLAPYCSKTQEGAGHRRDHHAPASQTARVASQAQSTPSANTHTPEPSTEDHGRPAPAGPAPPANSATPRARQARSTATTAAATAVRARLRAQLDAVRLRAARSTQVGGLSTREFTSTLTPNSRPGAHREAPLPAQVAERGALHTLSRAQREPQRNVCIGTDGTRSTGPRAQPKHGHPPGSQA